MRGLIVGAVEGTRVAARHISATAGWELAGIITLPPEKSVRHSDFVDLSGVASDTGARLVQVEDSNSDEACKTLRDIAPDYTFVIGWSQICREGFRSAAGGKVIGYHPAALPRLRGRACLPWTILLDEKITASSLFWIDEGVDSGEILTQKFFHVAPRETAQSLYDKHMRALESALDTALHALKAGEEPRMKQDETCATYATRRRPSDGRIDWSVPAERIERLVRATGRPYPGAFTTYKDSHITIFAAQTCEAASLHAIPGQIVSREEDGFAVMCGDNRILSVSDFCIADGSALPPQHAVLGASV